MKLKRVVSKKTGAVGFWGRYTDRQTGRRRKKTIWIAERIDAEKAFQELQSASGKREHNIVSEDAWKMPYAKVTKKFSESFTGSAARLQQMKRWFEENPLKLKVIGELCNRGQMNQRCKAIAKERGGIYVVNSIQQPLKQLSAWAVECQLLPYDPLKGWRYIARTKPRQNRSAFTAEEMRAIFDAMDELDSLSDCLCPTSTFFKAFLVTGNRPTALVNAKVGDFDGQRIKLPPGGEKKRNGKCTVAPGFAAELHRYLLMRGRPAKEKPLFVTPRGKKMHAERLSRVFRRASTLAFVKLDWPGKRAAQTTPLEVALSIYEEKFYGMFGGPTNDPEKLAAREARRQNIRAMVDELLPAIEKRMANRPMYALRHTHITWARRFVDYDAVRAQVGHAGRDVEETNYNDEEFVHAAASSQAVWDVLTGTKSLERQTAQPQVLPMAVGQLAPIVAPTAEEGPENRNEPIHAKQVRQNLSVSSIKRQADSLSCHSQSPSNNSATAIITTHAVPFHSEKRRSAVSTPIQRTPPQSMIVQKTGPDSGPCSLSEVQAAWDSLPEHIRQTILTLVRAGGGAS